VRRLWLDLRPRASIYERFVQRPGFLDPRLLAPTRAVQDRLGVAPAATPRDRPGSAPLGAAP
jgi:hypothetical protein